MEKSSKKMAIGSSIQSAKRFVFSTGMACTKEYALNVHPDDLPPSTPNLLYANLHSSVYLGEGAQHVLSLHSGASLKVFELSPRVLADDNATLPVRFHIPPSAIRILLS